MPYTRRDYLALVGSGLAGTAGCLGPSQPDRSDAPTSTGTGTAGRTSTRSPTTAGTAGARETTTSPPGTETTRPPETSTTADGTLVLRAVDGGSETPLRVYPTDLREMLRAAVSGDGPIRTTGSTHVYRPDPVLPDFETVELVDPDGDATGVYAVDCQGGTRYDLLVGAEAANPPTDATVTPVETLPEERRALAVAAIENEGPRVFPETELGEWVRTEFFDGYVSHDGTTYRGTEIQQTDAAFFSTDVWYVLELSPTDTPAGVTLDLSPVETAVRDVLDPLLEARSNDQATAEADGRIPGDVRSFLAGIDRILTHPIALSVAVE